MPESSYNNVLGAAPYNPGAHDTNSFLVDDDILRVTVTTDLTQWDDKPGLLVAIEIFWSFNAGPWISGGVLTNKGGPNFNDENGAAVLENVFTTSIPVGTGRRIYATVTVNERTKILMDVDTLASGW